MQISLNEQLRSFRRSWVHHTGMQLATLTILASTFTVVAFVLSVSLNLKRLLAHWGDSVQMTVYVQDDISNEDFARLKGTLEADRRFKSVKHVPKEAATQQFKFQMANYAPDLLEDTEFANPFPASFQIGVGDGVPAERVASVLEETAQRLSKFPGVEDVSYGQSWVRNYSAFVKVLSGSGWVIVFILGGGSLFVIGNSVRSSIAGRRDEIEILELVGATPAMIRIPFVFEGALMGALAAGISLIVNFGLYFWEVKLLQSNLALTRVATNISFFGLGGTLLILLSGTAVGAIGAYLTVRQINDGWSASQRLEA